ncbi:MAG: GNAT family N-acetyltransferase [Pseudomonadota bacterium]
MSDANTYAIEPDLSADEFISVLKRSTLAERRPVNERARIEKMLANADIIVTARGEDGVLIGVSRCVSDFSFCCYCSDLAVDKAYQGKGVGKRLLDESAKAAGAYAHFILLAAPGAVTYYEHIGMRRLDIAYDRPDWKRFADAD